MKDFLETIRSDLSVGQASVLTRFLADVEKAAVPGQLAELEALLDGVGPLLPVPGGSPTDPEVYNQTLRVILANLSGLYGEVDQADTLQTGLEAINRTELEKIENALRDLATLAVTIRRVRAARFQPTDVFFESFSGEPFHETDRRWFRPLPQLEAVGRVEAFLPAYIDPVEKSLKLQPGGDFSRTLSTAGESLVQVEVEEVLGFSSDRQHPVQGAVDGVYGTYWRELILSEGPIHADPLQVPWLPDTYTGGAACRLHFRYPFSLPFTEVLVRGFSQFPSHVLQVVWDNRKQVKQNLVSNGNFASGMTHWTASMPTTATSGMLSTGSYQGLGHVSFILRGGTAFIQNRSLTTSGSRIACHLVMKARYDNEIRLHALATWKDSTGAQISSERVEVQGPPGEWFEYSRLLIPPQSWASGSQVVVTLQAEGSGTVYFSDVSFSPVVGWWNADAVPDPETDLITVPTPGGHGTDVWIVLSQPHYEFVQYAIPEGDLDAIELSDHLTPNPQNLGIIQHHQDPWAVRGNSRRSREVALPTQENLLIREVRRLGGRLRELVNRITKYTNPSADTRYYNRYTYSLGAWDLQIRHREYAPHGLYVSRPYHPRGEVRYLQIASNPSLTELGDEVRMWITPRASDSTDKAELFSGECRFFSSHETIPDTDVTHFVMSPVRRREVFNGTDHHGVIELANHPYVNLEQVWEIQSALSSGTTSWPLRYDGNKTVYQHYVSGSPWARIKNEGYILGSVAGYRPVRVWLEFPDGRVARPDSLGRVQPGEIGYSGLDLLETIQIEKEVPERKPKKKKRGQLRLKLTPQSIGKLTDWWQQSIPGEPKAFNWLAGLGTASEAGGAIGHKEVTRVTRRRNLVLKAELHTRFKNILAGPDGASLSLYLHKSSEAYSDGRPITSGDVLIPHRQYIVDAETGVIQVHTKPPNGNLQYDTFIAYYYFLRDENQREEFDVSAVRSLPTSGVDTDGDNLQIYPVTRNVTDYIQGSNPVMERPELDDLLPDYYPVYEYYVTPRGEIQFTENFHPFSDTPARVVVEYDSLMIEPRLIIEFPKKGFNAVTTRTPSLLDFSLLMSAKH